MAEYPNLPLLEYIFNSTVKYDNKNPNNIDAYVFPQTWPNTGGGFAEPGCCYGQAFTKEYTTVFFDMNANVVMVAFGNRPAYVIQNPNQTFVDDFNKKNMKSKHEALLCYKENKENE